MPLITIVLVLCVAAVATMVGGFVSNNIAFIVISCICSAAAAVVLVVYSRNKVRYR